MRKDKKLYGFFKNTLVFINYKDINDAVCIVEQLEYENVGKG